MAKKKPAASAIATLTEPKEPTHVVETAETRCQKCDSTKREKYSRVIRKAIPGIRDGKPHTHVVWRYTRCANPGCRRSRIDKSFENDV